MKLTLNRTPREKNTLGVLSAEICYTLEDPVRDVKIPGETAIPAGRYRVTLENSPKFGPDTITLHNVPDFQYIRIHAGNTVDDTEGCPLVGLELSEDGLKGGTSQPALRILKALVKASIQERKDVWIEIK